jgi:hypothetical protein
MPLHEPTCSRFAILRCTFPPRSRSQLYLHWFSHNGVHSFRIQFFGSVLTNSQGALLPIYSSAVNRLQISQCHCCPSY